MFSKVTIFLTIALLIQGYNCKTTDEVIEEARVQIAQVQDQISKELRDAQIGTGQTRQLVQQSVGNAEKKLRANVDKIQALAKQLKAEAQASGRNIDDCLNSLKIGLNALDFHDVGRCANNLAQLDQVGQLLQNLRQVKHDLGGLIRKCSVQYPTNASKLQKCINNGLNADKKQANNITKQINHDLTDITDKSLNCIETNLNNLTLSLEKVKRDLQTCAAH